jgi:hypothetical protein
VPRHQYQSLDSSFSSLHLSGVGLLGKLPMDLIQQNTLIVMVVLELDVNCNARIGHFFECSSVYAIIFSLEHYIYHDL